VHLNLIAVYPSVCIKTVSCRFGFAQLINFARVVVLAFLKYK